MYSILTHCRLLDRAFSVRDFPRIFHSLNFVQFHPISSPSLLRRRPSPLPKSVEPSRNCAEEDSRSAGSYGLNQMCLRGFGACLHCPGLLDAGSCASARMIILLEFLMNHPHCSHDLGIMLSGSYSFGLRREGPALISLGHPFFWQIVERINWLYLPVE